MADTTKSIRCVRDARAYPPECFSLPTDGRKYKKVCRERREVFIQWATYADGDGSRGYPGVERMALELGMAERTLKRRLAELVELACLPEAKGPCGKIKLHGPRGTTERLVVTSALPLPGSTAWFEGPDGKKHRLKLTNENVSPLAIEIRKLLGQIQEPVGPNSGDTEIAVGPDTNAVGPNSTPVGPDSKAVGPKPADFGPQPSLLPSLTATSTATNPSTPGEVVGAVPKNAGMGMVDFLAEQLQYTALPASKKEIADLENLAVGVPGKIMAAAIRAWVSERPAGFNGLKFPVGQMVIELPKYIKAALAAANAPPPGELPPMTPEQCAQARADFLAENNITEEEFAEIERQALAPEQVQG
jgi:hypothetical protein